MTLQQLRVLVAVVEQRSFTRGAQSVYMTQSAASQHVRSLEQALGVALVERISGDVVPTRAGEGLLSYAKEILRLADDAGRFAAALRGGSAGRLAIGAAGSAVYLVPSLLSGFRAAYPAIDVSLQIMPRPVLSEALARGTVDVAMLGGPVGGPGVATQALCPDRLVLAVCPTSALLPAAALAPCPLARAAAEPIIAPAESAPSWRLVEHWALGYGVELRPAQRVDNPEAIKKVVEAGAGVAFLSGWVVEREVALGTLRIVPIEPPLPTRQYELAHRAAARMGLALETFLRFAPEYLGQRVPPSVAEPAARPVAAVA